LLLLFSTNWGTFEPFDLISLLIVQPVHKINSRNKSGCRIQILNFVAFAPMRINLSLDRFGRIRFKATTKIKNFEIGLGLHPIWVLSLIDKRFSKNFIVSVTVHRFTNVDPDFPRWIHHMLIDPICLYSVGARDLLKVVEAFLALLGSQIYSFGFCNFWSEGLGSCDRSAHWLKPDVVLFLNWGRLGDLGWLSWQIFKETVLSKLVFVDVLPI
jgi:hypothetical protein